LRTPTLYTETRQVESIRWIEIKENKWVGRRKEIVARNEKRQQMKRELK
jgi:hypothetical protein